MGTGLLLINVLTPAQDFTFVCTHLTDGKVFFSPIGLSPQQRLVFKAEGPLCQQRAPPEGPPSRSFTRSALLVPEVVRRCGVPSFSSDVTLFSPGLARQCSEDFCGFESMHSITLLAPSTCIFFLAQCPGLSYSRSLGGMCKEATFPLNSVVIILKVH